MVVVLIFTYMVVHQGQGAYRRVPKIGICGRLAFHIEYSYVFQLKEYLFVLKYINFFA